MKISDYLPGDLQNNILFIENVVNSINLVDDLFLLHTTQYCPFYWEMIDHKSA